MLRPIPANAALITSHRNLGARLESMATNIFLKAIFDSNEAAVKNLLNNRYAARILASRSIIAYVPGLHQSPDPALAISSWVGGWAPVLRWALWIHPPRDVLPLGEYNGHRLWTLKKPVSCFGAVNFLSFAIDEGVFIGCLSHDRNGIVYLLGNYDGRKDSILDVPACNAKCRFPVNSPAADQVWMRIDLPNTAQNKSVFAVCSLDALENDHLAATIRFEPDPGFVRPGRDSAGTGIFTNNCLGQNQNFAEIAKMYACSPSVVALLPSDMVAAGLDGLTRPGGLISPAWARAVRPILAPPSGANNVCMLMVLTGAYGGKFGKEPFRITVPTFLLAVSGSKPEQTKEAVLSLLDLINIKHRLGLILNSTLPPAGKYPLFAVESTSGALLKSLPVEDQSAFAFYNDWFLLASNGAGLRSLLLGLQSPVVPAADENNKRLEPSDGRPAQAFIRIDPAAGGKALRLAITASIIMLNTDDKNASRQNTIKILRAARSWLEGIGNLEDFMVWMEPGGTVVRLEIGRKNH